jgi:hypothetical protein
MTKRTYAALLAVLLATGGCDKIRDKIPFLGKKKAADTTKVAAAPAKAPATAPAAAAPTKATPAPAQTKAPAPSPTKAAPPPPAPGPQAMGAADEPWTPKDTGTVSPGMTRDQVVTVWGKPEVERTAGRWSYLYYRNGCEVSCGTFDLVVLDGGQVIDAVVRGRGHTYSGVSSSPANRAAKFTPPIKADSGRGGQ